MSTQEAKDRMELLTCVGHKQLVRETAKWKHLTTAIGRILGSPAEGR
jgi:hypothetical protein